MHLKNIIHKHTFVLCSVVILLLWSGDVVQAQHSFLMDTAAVHNLPEVTIVEQANRDELRATAPTQKLTAKELESIHAFQVSDALKHLSGVTVKDYGGIGGLKTVSVRSLGAAHTSVSYDGVTLSDTQTGQIDLGRFSLDNIELLSLSNGQSDNIFQPARQFSSSAMLDIRTKRPTVNDSIRLHGKASLKGGSFGLFNPSYTMENMLSNHLSLYSSVEWMSANGAYPYVLNYGVVGVDSSSVERRKNSDVQNLRIESTLYGSDSIQDGHVKLYYFQSERGLPGATIFYNTENFSSQRVWDRTLFAQGHYHRRLSQQFRLQLNGKYQVGYLRYLDPTVHNSNGFEDSRYLQQEYYLSAGALYQPLLGLQFALSTDGIINTLDANSTYFSKPTRYSWLVALTGKYVNNYITASASLLSTFVNDEVKRGDAAEQFYRLSPYAGVSLKPFQQIGFRVRAFYKNTFRLPTFNDLYYLNVGNVNLKPENSNQVNVGVTFDQGFTKYIPSILLSVDGYYNEVTNKIVAYPTKNLFTWTMLNFGKVAIHGLDINGEVTLMPFKGYAIILGATYTYQRALNVTDKDSREYGHQIPYTPRISGSGKATFETPYINLSYALIWSGDRYAVNQNYAENRLPGFIDQSLSAYYRFTFKSYAMMVNAECLNLANTNYAVVRYFPMPGRSWRATISFEF